MFYCFIPVQVLILCVLSTMLVKKFLLFLLSDFQQYYIIISIDFLSITFNVKYPFELFYQIDWSIFNVKFFILNSRLNFSTRLRAYICVKVTSKIWFWIMPVIIENSCHNYDVWGLWAEKFHNDIGQYSDLSGDHWLKISLIQSKSVLRSG